jgi:hypothetical protein
VVNPLDLPNNNCGGKNLDQRVQTKAREDNRPGWITAIKTVTVLTTFQARVVYSSSNPLSSAKFRSPAVSLVASLRRSMIGFE